MIKVQLELGGKDPGLRLRRRRRRKAAAASIADGAFYNTGQSCCSVERIYVHEKIHDAFVDAFVAEVKGFKVGDPADERTYIGADHAARRSSTCSQKQVADAKKRGARLLTGGKRRQAQGQLVRADRVHRRRPPDGADARRELRARSSASRRSADDDEAVALMNDSDYGLTAGVYTADEKRARGDPVAGATRARSYWNCCDRVSPRLPWSGVRHSGIGLTLSTYGIQTFTRPKAWHLRAA